jgi:Tfp pilus assembly protein PilV
VIVKYRGYVATTANDSAEAQIEALAQILCDVAYQEGRLGEVKQYAHAIAVRELYYSNVVQSSEGIVMLADAIRAYEPSEELKNALGEVA